MIYLSSISELNYIKANKEYIEVGSQTSLTDFEFFIEKYYPDFSRMLKRYGSVGIRAKVPDELDEKIKEMINTNKPVIFDADNGGRIEHLSYLIRSLERAGISALVIEDKVGLKKNSLYKNQLDVKQDSIINFCSFDKQ